MSAVSAPGSGRFEAAHCAVPVSEISADRLAHTLPSAVPPLVRYDDKKHDERQQSPARRGPHRMPIATMHSRNPLFPRRAFSLALSLNATTA
jgi:hypothetical protein